MTCSFIGFVFRDSILNELLVVKYENLKNLFTDLLYYVTCVRERMIRKTQLCQRLGMSASSIVVIHGVNNFHWSDLSVAVSY